MGKGIYPPSVQPGIPRLGKTPDGWKKVTFGDILTDIQRPVKLVDIKNINLLWRSEVAAALSLAKD